MEFIFMLTHNDRTVDAAMDVLERVIPTGLQHIGFKDVGATPARQREITAAAHAAGMTVYLEVVSVDIRDELAAVEAAVDAGVDWVVGGKNAAESIAIMRGSGIKFAPFPGRVLGHPSELKGSVDEIVDHAVALSLMEGVDALDLLAYRHKTEDPCGLMAAVTAAVSCPVIAAGSVVREDQIAGLAAAGAWGFTIGGAIFDAALPAEPDIAAQVSAALRFAQNAYSLS